MSAKIDLTVWKEIAKAATQGEWRHIAVRGGWDGVGSDQGEICSLSLNHPFNADHIAASSPGRVLALIEALKIARGDLLVVAEMCDGYLRASANRALARIAELLGEGQP